MKEITTEKGKVNYINSGDWVESLTAVEYQKGVWKLYQYHEKDFEDAHIEHDEKIESNEVIFNSMLSECNLITEEKKS